jgi:hypothetical protein
MKRSQRFPWRPVACAAPHRSSPKKLKRAGMGPRGLDLRNTMVRPGSDLSRHRQGSGDCALVLMTQGLAEMERVPPGALGSRVRVMARQ